MSFIYSPCRVRKLLRRCVGSLFSGEVGKLYYCKVAKSGGNAEERYNRCFYLLIDSDKIFVTRMLRENFYSPVTPFI